MEKYVELNASNFADTIKEGVVLVDFWAPWSGHCMMIEPIIEKLAADFKGKAVVAKVNIDDNMNIVERFGIKSIPTILFFKDGELVDQINGAVPKQTYADKLNELI